MLISYELNLENFEAWSGAIHTLNRVRKEGLCEQLEFILEDLFPDGMTEVQLNDLLWCEPELIYEWLGIGHED
jgi:hypothetical protein